MEGPIRFSALSALLLACACSHTLQIPRPDSRGAVDRINAETGERAARVILVGRVEENPPARTDVKVGIVETRWLETSTLLPFVFQERDWYAAGAPTAAIERIVVRNHVRGAWDGLLLGLVPGVIAGLAGRFAFLATDACQTGCSWVVFAGPAVGVDLIGILLGAAIGHRTTLEFVDTPAAPGVLPQP